MSISWKYVKPLKEGSKVKEYVRKNRLDLPDDLIHLLESNNGGRPSDKTIQTDAGMEYVFKNLFSFNEEDIETIYKIYPVVLGDTSLFPFGSDSAGNLTCYDMESGKYVLYNHETGNAELIVDFPALDHIL